MVAPNIAHADGLGLGEAIQIAIRNNETSRLAELRVDAAEGSVESARAQFLPTLTFGASAQADAREDNRGRHFSESGTLTLRQPLLRPSAIPSYRASKFNLEAAKHGAGEDTRALAYDTAHAFLDVVTAERVVKAAEGRLERAKADLEDASARVDAQLNSSNDMTRARLDVSSATKGVTSSKSSLERARLELGFVLGQPVTEPLDAPEWLGEAALNFEGEAVDLSKTARDRRGDLKEAHEQTLAARAQADEPMFRLIPSIDLTGQIQINPDPAMNQPYDDETVTLSLTWTIFDGGARYGDRRTRAAQAESAELTEQKLSRNVDTGVRSALVSLAAAKENLHAAEDAFTAAQANSEETQTLYRQGLARAIEVTDANASRFDAEVGLAEARLELVNAYLDVRDAMGQGPLDDTNKVSQ